MNIRKTGIRGVRKGSHLTGRVLQKGASFAHKVEDKTTRILTGKDFSIRVHDHIAAEKAYYGGLEYNIVPLNPALPKVGRKGTLTLLIPTLNNRSFYGGTATALIVASKLALKLGKPLRIIETLEPGNKHGLDSFFKSRGIPMKASEVKLIDVSSRRYNLYGYVDLHPDDDFIASAWWDAKLLSALPLTRPYVYLIQDFEPIFYSNSDEYVLAEDTYRTENFIPLCNTKLMHTFMKSEGYDYIAKEGLYFEPAVSKSKHGLSKQNNKKRLFLYGRPSVRRNLYYTALEAINQVFNESSLVATDWEICMAGQDKVPDIMLSCGLVIKNLGKMSSSEYDAFAQTVDLTVSPMMAPHPNYPTLELSSVGSAVVTTKYKTKQDLSNYSKNIIMSDPYSGDIAKAIVKASKLSFEDRIANAKSSNISDDWGASLDKVIKEIYSRLNN
jgi:hypothetical protein